MKIRFGAPGEGYATDRCRDMTLAKGIKAGIVNGSGDMSTWGKQPATGVSSVTVFGPDAETANGFSTSMMVEIWYWIGCKKPAHFVLALKQYVGMLSSAIRG